MKAPATSPTDFDLHGFVGVRVLDASERDVAAVRRQLGPLERPLSREPDVTIRFVDRVAHASNLRLLGVRDVGYDDEGFLLLRSRHKTPARVAVPFDRIGGRCEIRCERGLAAVPLLIPIVNLTALARGMLPLHASAFRYAGRGVLVTGWSKGGKTETLLAFLAAGAEYVGDEWVYLTDDGSAMYGIPEPIRVQDWHLDHLPEYRRRLTLASRARLRTLRGLSACVRPNGSGPDRLRSVERFRHRLAAVLDGQRYIHLPPASTFGDGFGDLRSSVDLVVLVGCHASEGLEVAPIEAHDLAGRMVFSLQEERHALVATYRKFRFAHPGRINAVLEGAADTERERLHRVLDGKPCFAVRHPYPVSIPALFEAIRPLVVEPPVVDARAAEPPQVASG